MDPVLLRRADKATYAHNVAFTFTTRNNRPIFADPQVARTMADFLTETDHYGLDKVRGFSIHDSAVTVIVAIPPNRSVAQVASRIKGGASLTLSRQFPALASDARGAWQRGYGHETLGARSMAWIAGYLAAIVPTFSQSSGACC